MRLMMYLTIAQEKRVQGTQILGIADVRKDIEDLQGGVSVCFAMT